MSSGTRGTTASRAINGSDISSSRSSRVSGMRRLLRCWRVRGSPDLSAMMCDCARTSYNTYGVLAAYPLISALLCLRFRRYRGNCRRKVPCDPCWRLRWLLQASPRAPWCLGTEQANRSLPNRKPMCNLPRLFPDLFSRRRLARRISHHRINSPADPLPLRCARSRILALARCPHPPFPSV
jgi:hypothetical protein